MYRDVHVFGTKSRFSCFRNLDWKISDLDFSKSRWKGRASNLVERNEQVSIDHWQKRPSSQSFIRLWCLAAAAPLPAGLEGSWQETDFEFGFELWDQDGKLAHWQTGTSPFVHSMSNQAFFQVRNHDFLYSWCMFMKAYYFKSSQWPATHPTDQHPNGQNDWSGDYGCRWLQMIADDCRWLQMVAYSLLWVVDFSGFEVINTPRSSEIYSSHQAFLKKNTFLKLYNYNEWEITISNIRAWIFLGVCLILSKKSDQGNGLRLHWK